MIRRYLRRLAFMRDHMWTHSHLSEYLDNELAPAGRRRVEEHVGMCPECRRVLAALRRTLEGLMGLKGEPRFDIATDVIERLRAEG